MEDRFVQTYNPIGVWVKIDRQLGVIADTSEKPFKNVKKISRKNKPIEKFIKENEMKNKSFIKYLFADTVSWLLLIATIVLVILHFVIAIDVSAFLAIAALNMFYNIFEKAKFLKKVNENVTDHKTRVKIGLE